MTNPKQAFGDKKPAIGLFPMSAQLRAWEALQDGANKYGPFNWRERPVEARTYIEAALRHLRLYENGEEYTRDTGVHNLGAVMACMAILVDAELHGTLIDNRVKSPKTCDLLHEEEKMMENLKELQKERGAPTSNPYT